ncbi:aminodeoxychorismate/anthranilate synthase component II [bacterium]|nr:aminodeoxychorismate/anthranilate synthase component II [bacterium]
MKILFLDNFDSFSWNLVDEFEKRGHEVLVYRNDVSLEQLRAVEAEVKPQLLVISPGPSTPDRAGVCTEALLDFATRMPVFGVCLGLQVMVEAWGGRVGRAPEVVHGKASAVTHDSRGVFDGLASPMAVGRYHSLVGLEIPDVLEVSADLNGLVMAARHCELPVEGVQFHPESILTPTGGLIIDRVLDMAERY